MVGGRGLKDCGPPGMKSPRMGGGPTGGEGPIVGRS
jgi:hypothetical protein